MEAKLSEPVEIPWRLSVRFFMRRLKKVLLAALIVGVRPGSEAGE